MRALILTILLAILTLTGCAHNKPLLRLYIALDQPPGSGPLLAAIKFGADLPKVADMLTHYHEGGGTGFGNSTPLVEAVLGGDLSELNCDQLYILYLYTNIDEACHEKLYPELNSRCLDY